MKCLMTTGHIKQPRYTVPSTIPTSFRHPHDSPDISVGVAVNAFRPGSRLSAIPDPARSPAVSELDFRLETEFLYRFPRSRPSQVSQSRATDDQLTER